MVVRNFEQRWSSAINEFRPHKPVLAGPAVSRCPHLPTAILQAQANAPSVEKQDWPLLPCRAPIGRTLTHMGKSLWHCAGDSANPTISRHQGWAPRDVLHTV